ncbi:methionyl-tRNA formyltransferase [Salimicrobium humidisoli]|uniref:Methionyl-tRNA formyltransferase n=1 Tax=Salimicrobium humidisoli TaxID=2029857 RepID=A0ABX4HRZ9_9BACI|nr:methionyl-tRNA formyltransferase [Salimicrobium humidisoli]PBB05336.1 methionyl-tRNA formyltransferase [Salimicrobium humidisoli]
MTNIVLMGTPDFSVPVLNRLIEEGYNISLVVTQPDRPKGRKKILTPPPLKEAAEASGIPVFQPEKVKKEYQKILEYDPDLIVTAAYGQILPKALLDYPGLGAINVHASLLPEYRGAAPIHYALMDGREETGVTIMYMVPELDAGDMLSSKKITVSEEDDVGTLHDKLAQIGAELLSETLPPLINGTIEAEVQDASKATFAPTIKRGEELVDFSLPRDVVWGHIRGMSPWPVAYTYWGGKPLKLWAAQKYDQTGGQAPGTVIDKTKEGIVVVCGDGSSVIITELQPSGKKRMDGTSFINGIGQTMEIGEVLGENDE